MLSRFSIISSGFYTLFLLFVSINSLAFPPFNTKTRHFQNILAWKGKRKAEESKSLQNGRASARGQPEDCYL